jgi:hypothetical protein
LEFGQAIVDAIFVQKFEKILHSQWPTQTPKMAKQERPLYVDGQKMDFVL